MKFWKATNCAATLLLTWVKTLGHVIDFVITQVTDPGHPNSGWRWDDMFIYCE